MIMPTATTIDPTTLKSWLWEAACAIRGPVDAPKFKDYILPLIFFKRLYDVFEDEIRNLVEDFGSEEAASNYVEKDHRLVRFFIPKKARWTEIVRKTTGLGEYLTDAVRAVSRENPYLVGVIDVTDFNATASGQRILDDDRLAALVGILNRHRLGLNDVNPDLFGQAYEYLLRKFAEGSGSSAGEFFTPPEAACLMALILDPEPGQTVYDPCCGSGGLLINAHLRLIERYGEQGNRGLRLPPRVAPLQLFGQDIGPEKFAMTRMNAVIHDMEAEVELGDTMLRPAFTESDGSLRHFDLVVANPMWNQDNIPVNAFEADTLGRFIYGIPPPRNADWGWVQHMLASLHSSGRMAIVLDTGSVTRGSGTEREDKEHRIRKALVERDLVEAVFLLPENLFYNTLNAGIILVLNKRKRYPSQVLMIDLSFHYENARPKNLLTSEAIQLAATAYSSWSATPGTATTISVDDVRREDYNLLPTRYVAQQPTGDWLRDNQQRVSLHLAILKRSMLFSTLSQSDVNWRRKSIPAAASETRLLGELLIESDLRLSELDPSDQSDPIVLSLTKESGLIVQDQRFSRSMAIDDLSDYKVVKSGWIVYNPMVIWEGAIHALYEPKLGVVSPAYKIWVPQGIDYRFLDYLLKTPDLLAEYRRLASGGVNRRRIVSTRDFKRIRIELPPRKKLEKLMIDLDQAIERVAQEVMKGIDIASKELDAES